MDPTNLFSLSTLFKKNQIYLCGEPIFNSVTLYGMSSSALRCLKLETIIYTSMYSVLHYFVQNSEHVTVF